MNESIIRALGLAVLSYDEDNIIDHTNFLFREYHILPEQPHFEQHWIEGKNSKSFYGIVVDWRSSIAYLPCRGTDGDNFAGKIQSWMTNLNAKTGDNDIHDGFEHEGNLWFDEFKRILPKVSAIVTCGQSQGASVQQYVAKLCLENLSGDKVILSHGWSVPPWCREETKKTLENYEKGGRIQIFSYYHENDPVCSRRLYELTNASMVGNWIKLPCPIRSQYNLGPANAVTHSCRMYVDSMIIRGIKNKMFDTIGFETLVEISERCVN